jgi:hypothetical protein
MDITLFLMLDYFFSFDTSIKRNNMKDFWVSLNKGLIPAVFALLSLFLIIAGISGIGIQSIKFLLGSSFTFIFSVVWLLLVFNVIRSKKATYFAAGITLVSALLVFGIYRSIAERFEFLAQETKVVNTVVQRMKKIREAQVLFREVKGEYAADFSSLITFIREGEYPIIRKTGNADDSVAVARGLVSIDTTWVPVFGNKFMVDFPIDSLPFVPYATSSLQFNMAADKLDVDGTLLPVFEATAPYVSFLGNLYKENDYIAPPADSLIRVGSLTEPTTNGNWRE